MGVRYLIGYLVGLVNGVMIMRSIHTHSELKRWKDLEQQAKQHRP